VRSSQELETVPWSAMRVKDERYDSPEALLVMEITESPRERVKVTRSRYSPCFQPRQWKSSRTSSVTVSVGADDGMTISIVDSVADPLREHALLSNGIPATAWARMLFASVRMLSNCFEIKSARDLLQNPAVGSAVRLLSELANEERVARGRRSLW